jgi:hypothetical protein
MTQKGTSKNKEECYVKKLTDKHKCRAEEES